jgi:hypothetical protein
MTVYSKLSYDDHDDGRILKAARKQQYIMFPCPIAFLNDKLKAELGMKTKKAEEEDDAKFYYLKVPMAHEYGDSKMHLVKIKKYHTGAPEEFLRCGLTLNKQMKNHGYSGNYEMVMNLAQAMLAGHGLEAFLVHGGPKKSKTRCARPRRKPSILRRRFMIVQNLNW